MSEKMKIHHIESKEIFKENEKVNFEYYTETDVVTGSGFIVWINEYDAVVKDLKGKKHMMQIGCLVKQQP